MIRFTRLPLLMLFALLQCVAPLSHAHVDGHSVDQHVHVPDIDSPWINAHDSDSPHLSVEPDHSNVVCMPPEYRCSDLTVDQAAIVGKHNLLLPREYAPVVLLVPERQSPPLPPYQHPCSQAPPV